MRVLSPPNSITGRQKGKGGKKNPLIFFFPLSSQTKQGQVGLSFPTIFSSKKQAIFQKASKKDMLKSASKAIIAIGE